MDEQKILICSVEQEKKIINSGKHFLNIRTFYQHVRY